MAIEQGLASRFKLLEPCLDERRRRLWAAAESAAIGRGGISLVARICGVSRRAIRQGLSELQMPPDSAAKTRAARIRKKGGGRKKSLSKDPSLIPDLEKLVAPVTRGEPEFPLRWTCKSVRTLADELNTLGHDVSHTLVAELLRRQQYSLQANRNIKEGASYPDRIAQFQHIGEKARAFMQQGQPVIAVASMKKELAGEFRNVVPEGVYDLGREAGWITVATGHDTAAFAVASIRQWWSTMGRVVYPKARHLLITADTGGSNAARVRLWKLELQKFSNETGLELAVCHFPPGTSKWNRIEHRMFSLIIQSGRGKPPVSHAAIVNLIGATTIKTGLHGKSRLDAGKYLHPDSLHVDWNYSIQPR